MVVVGSMAVIVTSGGDMGLLDEIRVADRQPDRRCVFADFVATLDDKDRKDLLAALDDLSITSKAIFVVCRTRGYVGGDSVVRRHRRKECVCH